MTLLVQIEINGKFIDAGKITGTNYLDAVFSYFDEYVENQNLPISINLPLQSRSFSSEKTNEHLCLLAARKLGIKTCENFIVEAEDGSIEDDTVLFATKRYDRVITENSRTADGLKIPFRLHQHLKLPPRIFATAVLQTRKKLRRVF